MYDVRIHVIIVVFCVHETIRLRVAIHFKSIRNSCTAFMQWYERIPFDATTLWVYGSTVDTNENRERERAKRKKKRMSGMDKKVNEAGHRIVGPDGQ